jgi:hypothetical protein
MIRSLAMAAALSASAALPACYSGVINSPPSNVEIVPVTQPIERGKPALFRASATDPDNDDLTFQWSMFPNGCDDQSGPPAGVGSGATVLMTLTTNDNDLACVCATASDPHGATAQGCIPVTVGNQPPTANITVQQPTQNRAGNYDLYSAFRLSAAGSVDPDDDVLTRTWGFEPPAFFTAATLADCAPAAPFDLVRCFGPVTEPGMYKVSLIVNDGRSDSPRADVTLVVDPDGPPCIIETSPEDPTAALIWDPAADKSFTVLNVRDDGDPYPAVDPPPRGGARFSWSLRRSSDAFQPIQGFQSLPSVTIPRGSFITGDRVQVRVEVSDRLPAHDVAGCGDLDICSPHAAGCVQRITWTVDYR